MDVDIRKNVDISRRFTMPGHNMLIQKLFVEFHVNQMMWSYH